MPSSDPSNISKILEIVISLKPISILDIGIGTGKYGLLFRDYLDGHWAGNAFHDKNTWQMKMVGIEVFEKYLTAVHNYVYDCIWIGDAYQILTEGEASHIFDLVFMGDVIEHFDKEQGIKLLRAIKNNWLSEYGKILISTPNFQTQINNTKLAIFGNQYEVHKCRWYPPDFKNLGMKCEIWEGRLLTVLLSNE